MKFGLKQETIDKINSVFKKMERRKKLSFMDLGLRVIIERAQT